MIATDHPRLSIRRQCELVSISRASFYRQPAGESTENLELMRLIDEAFMEMPWYGSRQMARHLRRLGWRIGRKRVRRLMKKIGLVAIYQAPKTSEPHPQHKIYPYLLRHLSIDHPDQVWCADVTYIPMRRGFLYLAAIMDWFSRKVLAWRLSNTLEADFCVAALKMSSSSGYGAASNTSACISTPSRRGARPAPASGAGSITTTETGPIHPSMEERPTRCMLPQKRWRDWRHKSNAIHLSQAAKLSHQAGPPLGIAMGRIGDPVDPVSFIGAAISANLYTSSADRSSSQMTSMSDTPFSANRYVWKGLWSVRGDCCGISDWEIAARVLISCWIEIHFRSDNDHCGLRPK